MHFRVGQVVCLFCCWSLVSLVTHEHVSPRASERASARASARASDRAIEQARIECVSIVFTFESTCPMVFPFAELNMLLAMDF